MTFTVAYLTNAALILMIYAGNRVNVSTYAGLARAGLGPIGSFLVTTAVLMNGLGTMVSYLIIIGSEIPKLSRFYLPGFTLLSNRTAMVILLSCVCIAPLLFWKSIGRLKNVSIIGVLCVPIIVLTVFYRSFISPGYYQDHQVNFDFFGQNVFPSMGVMSFAFVSNHTAFMSYQTLRDRSVQRWIKATFMALTAALLISLSLAVVGYSAFGEDLQANVLAVFPADDNYINFASLVLACSMFVSYPMQFYPSRVALLTLLGRESLAESPSTAIHYPYSVAERKQRRWRYRLVTVLLFAFTVLIAVLVEDLGKVYELVGGIFRC
jgi:sodium-coupled neutral amino acid transporter 11